MQRLAMKIGWGAGKLTSRAPAGNRAPLAQEIALFEAIREDTPHWQRLAFDEYHGLVFGLLIKALGPQGDVEDLVSDVFVGFFESAKNIRQADKIRGYIVSITMNAVRREIRRRKRRRALVSQAGPPTSWERGVSNDDPKAKAALIQLSRILDEMDTEDRIAFVASGLADMSLHEISEILGVSVSTAKRRVRRAHEHVYKRVSRNALLADYIRERVGGDRDV